MRNDEQIASLLMSFVPPIMGYDWYIKPYGARDEVVEHVANDFGLPIDGQDPKPKGRMRDRFSHEDYLRQALFKIVYGFSPFEQAYRLGEDGNLHVRKYARRPPRSLQQIGVAPDGGLMYIRQYTAGPTGRHWWPISIDGVVPA